MTGIDAPTEAICTGDGPGRRGFGAPHFLDHSARIAPLPDQRMETTQPRDSCRSCLCHLPGALRRAGAGGISGISRPRHRLPGGTRHGPGLRGPGHAEVAGPGAARLAPDRARRFRLGRRRPHLRVLFARAQSRGAVPQCRRRGISPRLPVPGPGIPLPVPHSLGTAGLQSHRRCLRGPARRLCAFLAIPRGAELQRQPGHVRNSRVRGLPGPGSRSARRTGCGFLWQP